MAFLDIANPCVNHYISSPPFLLQPDRGAKRPRQDDGGAAGGDEDSRGGKQQKGLGAREMARYREVAAAGGNEGGAEMREAEELSGDKKKILDKLMDQDEDEPEVRDII